MSKLLAMLDLLRKGAAVSEPALWKDRTALTLALTALILTATKVAKGFGYDLPISENDAATLAAGVAVAVGLLSTYATSDKVGILPAKPVPPDLPPVRVVDAAGPAPGGGNRVAAPELDRVARHERDYPRDAGG